MKEIKIEIDISHAAKMVPAVWNQWVIDEMRRAGVPFDEDGKLAKAGTFERIDDPNDLSKRVIIWRPENQ